MSSLLEDPMIIAMTQMVRPFMSHMNIRHSNLNGCRILRGKGQKQGRVMFSFLAKHDQEVNVEIRVRDLLANPELYIFNMIEGINAGLKESKKQRRIIVPVMAPAQKILRPRPLVNHMQLVK